MIIEANPTVTSILWDCMLLTLSHFENGCDVTAYFMLSSDWNAQAFASSLENTVQPTKRQGVSGADRDSYDVTSILKVG